MDRPAIARTAAVAVLGLLMLSACQSPVRSPDALAARVDRLLRESPLIDGHNDLMRHYHACRVGCPRGLEAYDLSGRAEGHTDIPRWRQGRLAAQLLNAGWTAEDDDNPTLEGTLKGFAFASSLAFRYPNDLVMARDSRQVRAAQRSGRISLLLALEHPGRLGTREDTVRRLAQAGLRANILAYSGPTELADGHEGPARHGGLSPLGREMVGWMQRHGVLVDLSHSSAQTARDVLDIATAPVIFSHSSAAALCDVSRNVPDDVLRRMPRNGGIVMVSFVPEFTSPRFAEWQARGDVYWESLQKRFSGDRAQIDPVMARWEQDNPMPRVTVAEVADHVEHIRRVAGVDHVGLGGDYDGIANTIRGLEDVSGYPRLFIELARRGWSDEDLRKLAGENFLRVLDAADAVRDGGILKPAAN